LSRQGLEDLICIVERIRKHICPCLFFTFDNFS
jgi:hypothetical protein